MAKHEVIIRENTSSTKTDAPYLPQYVKKNDLAFSAVCSQVAAESGLTETQVRAIFEGAFAEFESLEQESAVRIHVDGMTVALTIYGSFASSDAAFNPLKNTLALAIYLDDDVRNALVNVIPVIVTDETATKVRITLVADEAMPRPYEVIHGQNVFEVQGYNLVMTDTGAGVELVAGDGTVFACTIDESVSKQKLRVHSSTLLEGGDYKLVVKSRGGDAEGALQTVFRKVKYLKIQPPAPATITSVRSASSSADFHYKVGEDVTITGTNLTLGTGETVGLKYDPPGGETVTLTTQVKSATETQIICDGVHGFNEVPEGLTAVVTVKTATHDIVAE